eukprot:512845-Rhodomonas_salina.1
MHAHPNSLSLGPDKPSALPSLLKLFTQSLCSLLWYTTGMVLRDNRQKTPCDRKLKLVKENNIATYGLPTHSIPCTTARLCNKNVFTVESDT